MCEPCGGASDFQAITVKQLVDEHKAKQNGHEAMTHVYLDHILTLDFSGHFGGHFGYFGD